LPDFKAGVHPVNKFILTALLVTAAGSARGYIELAVCWLFFFVLLLAFHIDIKAFGAAQLPFVPFIVFTFLVQLFVGDIGAVISPNFAMFNAALFFTLRLAAAIAFSLLFIFIADTFEIVKLLHFILYPLKLFRVKPADLAVSMLIALRFIPVLKAEVRKIDDARFLISHEKQKFLSRVYFLIIPLTIRAFNYVEQMSVTLEYRAADSFFFKLPAFNFRDILTICVLAVSFIFVVHLS
jgi:energy-coupling factor transport system permease protein